MPDRFQQIYDFGIAPNGVTTPKNVTPFPTGFINTLGGAVQGAGGPGPFSFTVTSDVPKYGLIIIPMSVGGDIATDSTGVTVSDSGGNTYHTDMTGVSNQQPNLMIAHAITLKALVGGVDTITVDFSGWSGFGSFCVYAAAFGTGTPTPTYIGENMVYAGGSRDVSSTISADAGDLVIGWGASINAGSGSPLIDTTSDFTDFTPNDYGNGHTMLLASYVFTDGPSETFSLHDSQVTTRNVAAACAVYQP